MFTISIGRTGFIRLGFLLLVTICSELGAVPQAYSPERVAEAIAASPGGGSAAERLGQIRNNLVQGGGEAILRTRSPRVPGLFAFADRLPPKSEVAETYSENSVALLQDFAAGRIGPLIWKGQPTSGFGDCVAIVDRRSSSLCSGVLIASRVVLSAAHCECEQDDPDMLRVRFGSDAQDDRHEREVSKVRHYWRDRGWAKPPCNPPFRSEGDLRLLRLERDAPVGFRPGTLADSTAICSAEHVRVVGFGLTDAGKTGQKHEAVVSVASNTCTVDDSNSFGCTVAQDFVASSTSGEDTCRGDSGGPAYARDGGSLVLGVTSCRVKGPGPSCGVGGVYIRVDEDRRKWIDETLKFWELPPIP